MAGIVCALDLLKRTSSRDSARPCPSSQVVSSGDRLSASRSVASLRSDSSRRRSRLASHSGSRSLTTSFLAFFVSSSLRRERRWWRIHDSLEERRGFWETKIPLWHRKAGAEAPDFLDKNYSRTYRLDHTTFTYLARWTRDHLTHDDTSMRPAIEPKKRLAICLHWMAHSITFEQLGEIYHVGASTAHSIVHEVVQVLKDVTVRSLIKFPAGGLELDSVMDGFEREGGLPMCAGAIDGSFVHMLKPSVWGDTYWCYKNYIAILVLAVCDHRGQFTFIDVGRAGCVGDAFTWRESSLRRKIHANSGLVTRKERLRSASSDRTSSAMELFRLSPSS